MDEDIAEIEELYDRYLEMKAGNYDTTKWSPRSFNTGFNYLIQVSENGRVIVKDKVYGDFNFVNVEDAFHYYKVMSDDCRDLESWLISCELDLYRVNIDESLGEMRKE